MAVRLAWWLSCSASRAAAWAETSCRGGTVVACREVRVVGCTVPGAAVVEVGGAAVVAVGVDVGGGVVVDRMELMVLRRVVMVASSVLEMASHCTLAASASSTSSKQNSWSGLVSLVRLYTQLSAQRS